MSCLLPACGLYAPKRSDGRLSVAIQQRRGFAVKLRKIEIRPRLGVVIIKLKKAFRTREFIEGVFKDDGDCKVQEEQVQVDPIG